MPHPAALYSSDYYAIVQQGNKLTLAPPTEAEWVTARVFRDPSRYTNVQPGPDRSFQYNGHRLTHSRKTLGQLSFNSNFLSADERYLAVFSWDGTYNSPDPFSLFGSSRRRGHYFFDLYEVSSGRKLALIRGGFSGELPAGYYGFVLAGRRNLRDAGDL